jgi:hypothetical protein
MNTRRRFLETIRFGHPDRAPLFPEGIRQEVLAAWQTQGCPPDLDLASLFLYDQFEQLEPDLDPHPGFDLEPYRQSTLEDLRSNLDPYDPSRLPPDWKARLHLWKDRQHVLLLRIHDGFFLTMGVGGWHTFTEACLLLLDHPAYVQERLAIQAKFAARLAERILDDVEVDGVIFHDPIADPHGPLISPLMYTDFVLESFQPIMEVLDRFNVPTIIFRSYANWRPFLPIIVQTPINCIWACETNPIAMDFRSIRNEFGTRFSLIGGIDTDVLSQNKDVIRRELQEKVPPLLEQGGYIPLADGRVRAHVPFENYAFYRQLLEEIALRQNQQR